MESATTQTAVSTSLQIIEQSPDVQTASMQGINFGEIYSRYIPKRGLLFSEAFSDMWIKVTYEEKPMLIPAHKAILAFGSEMFSSVLSNWKTSANPVVDLTEINMDVLAPVLSYIYFHIVMDEYFESPDLTKSMLDICEYLGVTSDSGELFLADINACENTYLITAENFVEWYKLKNIIPEISGQLNKFIDDNYDDIVTNYDIIKDVNEELLYFMIGNTFANGATFNIIYLVKWVSIHSKIPVKTIASINFRSFMYNDVVTDTKDLFKEMYERQPELAKGLMLSMAFAMNCNVRDFITALLDDENIMDYL